MSQYSDLILSETGIVGYWRLGELSGTVADSKGTNTGTLVNSPTTGVAGAMPDDPNTGMTFLAASTQHITLSGITGNGFGNGPYSMELWFKMSASGANFTMFDFEGVGGASGSIGMGMGQLANGKVSILDGANRIISSAAAPLYNDGKWHHVVATKIVAGNVWKMYVDGVDVTTADTFPNQTTTNGASTNGRIGVQYNGGVQRWFFTGTLDEVAIYNVALTQTQAYTHFVAGLQSAIGYKPVITPHSGPLAIRRVRFGQRNRYADAAVAGPQNLSLTTTDAVTTADVASRTAQLLRTITDAPSTADVVGRILAAIRSTSEAVSTADVATRSATFLRSATDAVSATQAATRIGTFLRSTSEAVSATQAATRSGTFLRTTSDAVTSSDAAVGVKVKNVSASDAVTTSESATRLLSALRTGTDAVTTSDTALRTELDSRQGTDTVTTSESVTRLLVALRTVTDAPTSSDAATRLLVALRTVTESVTANQAATRLLSALRASTDAVTTADVATRLASIVRSVTEAVSTADTATRQATLLRTTSDAVTTSESATATANARTTSDSVTTSDVATTGQVLSRTASDGLTLSDAATSSGGASSTGTGHPGRPRNPRYGRQVREEMTRKPTIEDIRRVTVLVATNDVLVVRDAADAAVEYTDDERVLEMLLGV